MNSVLIVDDEESLRNFLNILFTKEGYKTSIASNGHEALELLNKTGYDVVLSDIKMSGMSGLELLGKIKNISPETEVIMMTAYGDTDTAVEAMKLGAYHYIQKPFKNEEIKLVVKKAYEKKNLIRENIVLKKEFKVKYGFENLIGASSKMLEVYQFIKQIAHTKSNVLIVGDSGTGKELAAKAIHLNSTYKDGPFVPINCGAIPENLIESELFGHMKGSFTGALYNKEGLFETANNGTILLDEISELPLQMQVKLLRVLQERNFRRVGGNEDIVVDTRVIAATNKDLSSLVKEGRFREDLFYRLNILTVKLPPLCERKEDIPILAEYFLKKFSNDFGKEISRFSDSAMSKLMKYDFPGNVRELENIVERAIAMEQTKVILPETLPELKGKSPDEPVKIESLTEVPYGFNLDNAVYEFEKKYLLKALEKAGGNKTKAAEILGISFRSIRYRLQKLGLEKED